MKKIPTLFKREFENHRVKRILPEVTEGCEWVLKGEGVATVKFDGSCCAIIDGLFYKRYDAKKGRKPPKGAIPCSKPDPITGHWPHWVKVDRDKPEDKWFIEALNHYIYYHPRLSDGTYEAIGKHFNGNPYKMDSDTLVPHGQRIINVERSFEGIKSVLKIYNIEGLVFWKDGEPQCKIKKRDFGFEWGNK